VRQEAEAEEGVDGQEGQPEVEGEAGKSGEPGANVMTRLAKIFGDFHRK
jgi:hypothetical protein